LRFPDVHENKIVFVSGEDIWTVSVDGGIAKQLTMHDGQERFPRFSPDGSMIAFTGMYDGNPDVYVMNSQGGNIRRVTYHPGYDEVVGWHPLKNKIIFSSRRHSSSRYLKLFLISPDGTGLEELILYDAVQGSFSADAKKIAYNKTSREQRTWKRYQGGRAQEVYIYDFETNEEKNITNFKGTDRIPMWIGEKIYFSSDRDRALNIYAYDTQSKEITKITNHVDYDVRRPSCGKNKIVYEVGGKIWVLDTGTGETSEVDVQITTDTEATRPYLKNVSRNITDIDISPSGKRALIVARGEVFTLPKNEGPVRNLSNNCATREKDAVWSPDGKNIAYLSDKSGEYEIYIINQNGKEEAVRLTQHKDGYRHTLRWSPNSKKIAYADQTLRCYILDINSKQVTEVDKAGYENVDVSIDNKPISDFSWSPDSRYLVYSRMNNNFVYQVYIYSLETKQINCASNGLFNEFNPVFTKDGEYLLFVSNRRFNPTFCDLEWEMVYKNVAGIYALTLRNNGSSFLPYKSDEVNTGNSSAKETSQNNLKVEIDFEGLVDRIEVLPLSAGNYRKIDVNGSTLYYLNKENGDFNKFDYRAVGPRTLYAYSFDNKKEREVIKDIDSYKLSADGSFIIYKKRNNVGIIPSSAKQSEGKNISLSELKIQLDPIAEWKQIFNEAWRMERDFYYEPGMHGLNWDNMKEKYGKLIDNATCRQDVEFIIGELIGELNTSHTYVYGGRNKRSAENVNIGLLGVDWNIDAKDNRYQVKKIYRVRDWSREVYPPLAKQGVNINEGDYIVAVNGREVTADKNIYSYFIDLADKQVSLLVNSKPTLDGAREVTVKPVRSESGLRYIDWLEYNRLTVEKASDGQIGYLYFPDTYLGSATDFPRYFYSQTKKKGLIIDGRFNGGGLDPEIFFQRLLKKPHGYWTRRYSADQQIPALAVNAHMACLTNRYAGSGGDELPYEFKWNKMGPVIGTRTWGGLVGVSMFIDLVDGSGLTAPDYRIYDENGNWVVENRGVEPDIVVEQKSKDMAKGYDTQLMKAVEVLMKKIKDEPKPFPKHGSYPVDK
jgi:tricorn protease